MNNATEPRNRAYPAGEDEFLRHLFDAERRAVGIIPLADLAAERAAYAQTRDALPRYGGGLTWGEDEGEPASGGQMAAIVGVICCGVLLLAGLAYLVYLGTHGAPWTR